jgi:cytochrome P450
LLVRWIGNGIYRVYFHPLSRFPGPKISAFTRLPHITAVAQGLPLQYIGRLHKEYGDVVRISPDELSFAHPQAWRDIYGHGSREGKGLTPPKRWRWYDSTNGDSSLINTQDPTRHARSRKIFTPAFSDRALTQQEPLFMKYANQLVRTLKMGGVEGARFDMVRMYNFTTFDIMGAWTFGESLHMLDNAEYDPWVKIIFQNVKRGVKLGLIYNYYPILAGIFRTLLHKTVAKMQYDHINHSATRVTKRLKRGRASQGMDLWDRVLEQEEQGNQGLKRGEMDANASLFMVAGTETTATLLSGLTYLLLRHPESMNKLVTEVRTAFASSDDITMDIIAGLPYLRACIKEALRKYPPVPVGLPHLTSQRGSTICGHYVPPNVSYPAIYLCYNKHLIWHVDHCRCLPLRHVPLTRTFQRPTVFHSRALDRR